MLTSDISATYREVLAEIGFMDSDMYPILTKEKTNDKIKYYLFDKIKIFTTMVCMIIIYFLIAYLFANEKMIEAFGMIGSN